MTRNRSKHLELAVIIPVYNEEEIIAEVITKWAEVLTELNIDFELVAYNDGSKDHTLKILKDLEKKTSQLIVCDKVNSGHGPTILKGYQENIHATWIFQVDSDDEMGPEYFKNFWLNREGYDFMIGRRYGRKQSVFRSLISLISRVTVHVFYGKSVQDVNCPYRLMRVEAFKICFFSLPQDMFAPNIAIAGYVAIKQLKSLELDVPHQNRVTGQASLRQFKLLNFKGAWDSFYQTIRFALLQVRKIV